MELLALFDHDGNVTDEKIERVHKKDVPKGRYFRVVLVFIQNSKGEFLIQRVSKSKGHVFATTGGHVTYKKTSLDTVKSEVFEELGIVIDDKDVMLFETENRSIAFQDSYYMKMDIDINELTLQEEEVEEVKWMSVSDIFKLIEEDKFRKGNIYPFYDLLELLKENNFSKVPLFFNRNRPYQKLDI